MSIHMKAVSGGKRGLAPCEKIYFSMSFSLHRLNFMEIIRLSQGSGISSHLQSFGDTTGFK